MNTTLIFLGIILIIGLIIDIIAVKNKKKYKRNTKENKKLTNN